jgi:hypothetical protein
VGPRLRKYLNPAFLSDPRVLAAISINLMPVAGIVLFGWSAFVLMMLYWLENIVIGIVTLGKILVGSTLRDHRSLFATIPIGAFFVFHYGLFCFVHGIFVWAIFGDANAAPGSPFEMPGAIMAEIEASPEIFWGIVYLCAVYVIVFLGWMISGAWRQTNAIVEMGKPYVRIVVLHVTIIAAGMPVIILGEPMVGVLILALIKTGFELYLATRHHFPAFDEDDAQAAQQKLETLWNESKR